MADEVDCWHALASNLGVEVIAPATVILGNESVTFTALLPQFGGECGMIIDPDWEVIGPHRASLLGLGYGFSAVSLGDDIEDEGAQEMLRDWGWSAPEPKPRWW